MVRGLFTHLRFPYAHFPIAFKADHVLDIVWEAIEIIEPKKLKVIVVCCDGASINCKMFRMHGELLCQPYNPVYKATNRYSEEERPVFFMLDVPHLLKKNPEQLAQKNECSTAVHGGSPLYTRQRDLHGTAAKRCAVSTAEK